MNEKIPEHLLSAYFDGEVTPEERAQFEARLNSDLASRHELELTRRISGLVRKLGEIRAPAGFRAAVMHDIERQMLLGPPSQAVPSDRGARRRARWMYGSGAFAAAAMLLVAVAYYARQPQGREAPKATVPVAAHNEGARPRSDEFGVDRAPKLASAESGQFKANEFGDESRKLAADAPAAARGERGSAAAEADAPARPVARQSQLILLDKDLDDAKIGDLVQAWEHVDSQVAVVYLTVVDRKEGLKGVQSLLARNGIAPDTAVAPAKAAPAEESARHPSRLWRSQLYMRLRASRVLHPG